MRMCDGCGALWEHGQDHLCLQPQDIAITGPPSVLPTPRAPKPKPAATVSQIMNGWKRQA
jgi:hypothetical protein